MEEFVFSIGSYSSELLPEVEAILHSEVEQSSRNRLPGLWKITDRLNQSQGKAPRKNRPVVVLVLQELILFALGVFLFVPGIMQAQKWNAMTVFGGLLILIAAARLLPKAGSSSEKKIKMSADALLQSLNRIDPKEKAKVEIRESDVRISSKSGERCMAFENMNAAYETSKLFAFVSRGSVTLVQKKNLRQGNAADLSGFLQTVMDSKFRIIEN
ncbi:MAG: hypothetical protein MJ118_07720 [Clostridia bacterium]|nr:hypothetical protein [Clostridia bacterium]